MRESHSLVLDIGTTGIKAFVFDNDLNPIHKVYKRLNKAFPKRGWVEQSPTELVKKSEAALQEVVKEAKVPLISFSGLGITNQRETTIAWDEKTGKAIYPAIVWEDVRTRQRSKKFQEEIGEKIQDRTGLRVDPYFSATKMDWILENVPKAEKLAEKNRLRFGTVDSWVLWNLTQEKTHATDYTNASRTLLFNIKKLTFDPNLLQSFEIPKESLPEVQPSKSNFGTLKPGLLGAPLPVIAICGDQQSSMYAAGNTPGKTKVTFGTGTFLSQVVGPDFTIQKPFFTTLVHSKPKPNYMVEYKIDCCGRKVDELLEKGRSLNPTIRKLAKELKPLIAKLPHKPKEIIVDGGFTQAKDLVEIMTEILGVPIEKQRIYDGTALGVAKLMQE